MSHFPSALPWKTTAGGSMVLFVPCDSHETSLTTSQALFCKFALHLSSFEKTDNNAAKTCWHSILIGKSTLITENNNVRNKFFKNIIVTPMNEIITCNVGREPMHYVFTVHQHIQYWIERRIIYNSRVRAYVLLPALLFKPTASLATHIRVKSISFPSVVKLAQISFKERAFKTHMYACM